MDKVIITVAITGSGPTREQNPNLPITPEEIASSAVECFNEGASIAHIHVRDPKTGGPSMEVALYEEVVERIRARCNMILNLSSGPGGRLVIGQDGKPDMESSLMASPERRVEHILKLKPEMCSLDVGTMNFGPRLFVNAQGIVDKMAEMIKHNNTKPELELFEVGHIQIANRLISIELVENPPHFQLCMGTMGGIAATPKNAMHFVYMKRGVLAKSNAELVKRAVDIIQNLNKNIASVDETREILSLNRK